MKLVKGKLWDRALIGLSTFALLTAFIPTAVFANPTLAVSSYSVGPENTATVMAGGGYTDNCIAVIAGRTYKVPVNIRLSDGTPINPAGYLISWTASTGDPPVFSVDQQGNLKGLIVGSGKLVTTLTDPVTGKVWTGLSTVHITLSGESVTVGQTVTVAVIPPLGMPDVSWAYYQPGASSLFSISPGAINGNEYITGLQPGRSELLAYTANLYTGQNYAQIIQINVLPVSSPMIYVTDVTINGTHTAGNITLKVGGATQLTGAVSPSNATNKNVIWQSSDPTVLSVSSTGLVTALKAGNATITLLSVDGSCCATNTIYVNN